jgi:hypothetical protein
MPLLTANADEREVVLLRRGSVLKGLSFKDAGFTLMHAVPVALQLQWQQEPVCNARRFRNWCRTEAKELFVVFSQGKPLLATFMRPQ